MVAALVAVPVTAGCTPSKAPTHPPSTIVSTIVTTRTAGAPVAPTPVAAGPTTAAKAKACPFADENAVHLASGLRLDRIDVLTSGGKAVGCRFYPVAGPTADCGQACYDGEHLPPGSQVVVEITTTRYASAADAKAAVAVLRATGHNAQPSELGAGVCFQNDLYPKDHGADWSCAFASGTRAITVATVQNRSYDAAQIAKVVARGFRAG